MATRLASDDLWAVVEPLLPPEPPRPKGGRPRIDDRACLTGILFVLKTGVAWEMLPQEMGCGSGMTCWRRLRDWQAAGIWDRLHRALLDRLIAARRGALVEVAVEMIGASPSFRLVEREMEGPELEALRRAAAVHLSLHRAEGFGLNILEALETGAPVVATHFSGNVDYGPASRTTGLFPGGRRPIATDCAHPGPAFDWAEADLPAAAAALREARAAWGRSRRRFAGNG